MNTTILVSLTKPTFEHMVNVACIYHNIGTRIKNVIVNSSKVDKTDFKFHSSYECQKFPNKSRVVAFVMHRNKRYTVRQCFEILSRIDSKKQR